jgi:hypothetical protein
MVCNDLFPADRTVLISMAAEAPLVRIARWLIVPFLRARAKRQLARTGAASVDLYAVGPNLISPVWIYQLQSAAGMYAESHLVPAPDRDGVIRTLIKWWIGCDPAAAGIVVVGRPS